MAILVTGAAGFIGYHVASALAERGETVYGIDNLNSYYDVGLKQARLNQLKQYKSFKFEKIDIADRTAMETFFQTHKDISRIIHLAAQAGVRYSVENPYAYIDSNITGHLNILEAVRQSEGRIKHLVYASSSSVYGSNPQFPFSIEDRTDHPLSLYAATKKADEMMTQCYCHLYGMTATGLRFFTVYGPWGRPDMAYFLFADAISQGKPIKVFNNGEMKRDFTYIDDIVQGVLAALNKPPVTGDAQDPKVKHRIYNLGNHQAEKLSDFIQIIEQEMGIEAKKEMLPMQMGDVVETYADIDATRSDLGYQPTTPITKGIPAFIAWYKDYYKIAKAA